MKHKTLNITKTKNQTLNGSCAPCSRFHVSCFKFHDSGGYAALFSFAIMLIVFTVVIGVFSGLSIKNTVRTRLNTSDLKNIYAADGFAEDVLRRIYDATVVDALDEETLTVGDVAVTLDLNLEGLLKRHDFNSLIYSRYSHSHTLLVDDTVPANIKIKEWKDSL
ncbi:MAG: hypothetical protein HYT38_01015 [Candidatus Sungbacteria bacterium]|uniref:Uncharacterized protein n=1 Tax=Candidatus Sungiibacteriota bacterium TaxID=2750080 RepID=A0A931YDE8_9BACT|nr:hypothetical protein [Candidatus Sungbacteria bacterium]MBI2465889.1 hypothetical protein [Candidatus Sungbacteria bacterium]